MITIDNGPESFGLPSAEMLEQMANSLWEPAPAAVAVPETPFQEPEAFAPYPGQAASVTKPVEHLLPADADEKNTIRMAVRDGRTDAGQDSLYALSEQVNGEHTRRDEGITVGSKTLRQSRKSQTLPAFCAPWAPILRAPARIPYTLPASKPCTVPRIP